MVEFNNLNGGEPVDADGTPQSAREAHEHYQPQIDACMAEINRLTAYAEQRKLALERARGCIKGLLARTPVRDVSETLAEIDAAIEGELSK